MTNGGRFSRELATRLGYFFKSSHVSLYANATLGLVSCLKCLDISGGRIITTPFTFAATAQSIIWSGATPVFVDIDPMSFNLSIERVNEAAADDVVAVMPVHVFGNIFDARALLPLRERYDTRIVIDAAHAFGNSSAHLEAIEAADASVISFHATKMFNSVEGGAVLVSDKRVHERLESFKNYSFDDHGVSTDIGLNAKMSEFHALMGVTQFKYIEYIEADRDRISERYIQNLSSLDSIRMINFENENNKSYFPILIKDAYKLSRDSLVEMFKSREVFVRKYFFPLLSDMPVIRNRSIILGSLQNARYVADRIICLPMYSGISDSEIDRVSEIVIENA